MKTILTGLWRNDSGDDVAEYALLVAMIALVVIVALYSFGLSNGKRQSMTQQLVFRLPPPVGQAAEALASLVGVAKVGAVASPVAVVRAAPARVQAAVKVVLSAGRVAAYPLLLHQSSEVSGLGSRPNQPLACFSLTSVLLTTECDESRSTLRGQQVSSSDLAAYRLVSRSQRICASGTAVRIEVLRPA